MLILKIFRYFHAYGHLGYGICILFFACGDIWLAARVNRLFAAPPPIRAVRASLQTSRAAGASCVVAWADAPPGESWKCRSGGGQRRGCRRRAAVGAPLLTVSFS